MTIISGTFRYMRRRNLGNYEHQEAEVSVGVNEDSDADALMGTCMLKVHQALGIEADVPFQAASTPEEAPKEEKPKRTRRTKAQIKADEEKAQLEAMAAEDKAMAAAGVDAPKGAITITSQEGVTADEEVLVEEDEPIIVDDEPKAATEEVVPLQELVKFATAASAATSGKDVNSLLRDRFGVSKLGQIEERDRAEACTLLKALIGE